MPGWRRWRQVPFWTSSAEEVQNGTWRHRLQPGIYIINGKKYYVAAGWM